MRRLVRMVYRTKQSSQPTTTADQMVTTKSQKTKRRVRGVGEIRTKSQ